MANYYAFLKWFRSPADSFQLWPVAALLLAPLGMGAVGFAVRLALTNDALSAVLWFFVVAVVGGGLTATFLFVPPNPLLAERLLAARSRVASDQTRHEQEAQRLDELRSRIERCDAERQRLLKSEQYRREAELQRRRQILERNWRAMRDSEFEAFLADVFAALGGNVEMMAGTGDQGVDLLVEFQNRRIAIQAKGYHHSVGNAAVQQAYAGMAHYGCNECMVVTNSRFTRGAVQLAQSVGCILVGEDEMADFVLGRLNLWFAAQSPPPLPSRRPS